MLKLQRMYIDLYLHATAAEAADSSLGQSLCNLLLCKYSVQRPSAIIPVRMTTDL